jgi:hypothetical protein
MGGSAFLWFALAGWIVMGLLTGWLASTNNRSALGWFLVGGLLGPLALLAVGLAPAAPPSMQSGESLGAYKVVSSDSSAVSPGAAVGIRWDQGHLVVSERAGSYGPVVDLLEAPFEEVEYEATEEGTSLTFDDVTIVVRPNGPGHVNKLAGDMASLAMEGRQQPERERSAGMSTAQSLRELAQLHEDGLITDQEFASKRRELLGRM